MVLLAVLGSAGVAAWLYHGAERGDRGAGTLEMLGHYGEVPEFALIERSGRPVRRSDLLGRVWVASFIYTQCTETCPLQTARMAQLQGAFASAADFRLVSITVDPGRDTPAALAAYAEKYGADPTRWLFLTGDKGEIYRLAKDGFRLGVVDPDDPTPARTSRRWRWFAPAPGWATHGSTGLVMHSARLVLLDRRAGIRAYHLPDDPASLDRLRGNLRTLLGA
jgi:cytochrome oxidase Cu insertion factor (SCO1/SenC/PrrC family)